MDVTSVGLYFQEAPILEIADWSMFRSCFKLDTVWA